MELRKVVRQYQQDINRRNQATLKAMSHIAVLGVIGGTSSGKTSIIEELVDLAPNEIGYVQNETSRRPSGREKINNREFTFKTKQEIIDDLGKGELLQVAIGPNGDLYCTRPSGYPKDKIGIIALVPRAVEEFRALPIKSFREAYIVPFEFSAWQKWFEHQAYDRKWSKENQYGRKREALSSYEFALAQTDVPFVLNDEIPRAANRLLLVAQGGWPDDHAKARRTAEENYRLLKEEVG